MSQRLQGVKDECLEALQRYREEEVVCRDQAAVALARESTEREATLRDADAKIDRVVQMMYSERSARDVADHQLAKQLEAVSNQFDQERGTRAKEHAELSRVLEAMRHDLDAELEKNASIWNQHLDMVKRLDVLVQEQSTAELSTQQRLTCLESETEKVRATVASMESTVATQHQAMQDDLNRRGEETLKAVRNEVKARENEQRHFAKDLETSWKSLEAKMSRMAEQTELGNASMAERARVLEQRCTDVEQQLQDAAEQRSYKEQALLDKVGGAVNLVDGVDLAQKSHDVLLQTTISKVEDLVQRMITSEHDLHQKANTDFWKPQMDQFHQLAQRHDSKLSQLEKEMNSRFVQASNDRDTVKVQMQDSLKACMEKVTGIKAADWKPGGRFVEINAAGYPQPVGTATGVLQVITPPVSHSVSRQISQNGISPRLMVPGGQATPGMPAVQGIRVTSPTAGGARLRAASPSPEPKAVA